MLLTIFLILAIAAFFLHLLMAYVAPMFDRPAGERLSARVAFCAIVAVIAIVLAILVAFHLVEIPGGLR